MKRTKSLSGRRGGAGYTIGRSRFAKISAVEGLRITAAMERDFQEFDRQGLSATKRRKIIARKYGKVR